MGGIYTVLQLTRRTLKAYQGDSDPADFANFAYCAVLLCLCWVNNDRPHTVRPKNTMHRASISHRRILIWTRHGSRGNDNCHVGLVIRSADGV